MRITELLHADGVGLITEVLTREQAIDALIKLQAAQGTVTDADRFRAAVLAREEEFSTAVGGGVAIPHAKTDAASAPGLTAITVPWGVAWGASDGKPCDLIFLIAAPATDADVHLEVLAKLSALLMRPGFPAALRAAKTSEDFISVLAAAEEAYDLGAGGPASPGDADAGAAGADALAGVAPGASRPDGADGSAGLGARLALGAGTVFPLLVALSILVTAMVTLGSEGAAEPFATWLAAAGSAASGLVMPVAAASIALVIAGGPGIAPGLVGGLAACGGYASGDPSAGGALAWASPAAWLSCIVAGVVAGAVARGLEFACRRLPASVRFAMRLAVCPLVSILIVCLVAVALDPLFASLAG